MKINSRDEFDLLPLDEYFSWIDRANVLIDKGYANLPTRDPYELAKLIYHNNKIDT